MTVNVFAGGLVFRGGEGDYGFFIAPGGFDGWEDGVGGDVDTAPRPSGGSHSTRTRLQDRIFTLRGRCHAESPEDLRRLGQRLVALGADGERFQVAVEQYGETLWAWARRAPSPPRFAAEPEFRRADYQLALWFPNFRRFGEARSSGPLAANERHTFVNRGTFEAHPKFIVNGPQPGGYTIVAPGRPNYQVSPPLPAGKVDVVDFTTGIVRRDGVPLLGGVVAPEVWAVPAAGTQEWWGALTGSGSITGEVIDTHV